LETPVVRRVLQERDVVVAERGRIERFVLAFIQGILEGNGAGRS